MKKRVALVVLAAVVVLGTLAAAPFAIAFSGNAPVVDGQRLGERVVVVLHDYVASYLVDLGENRYALVDGGLGPAPILAALAKRGAQADDVVAVLLTHAHPDHVRGAAAFPRAEVYALAAEVPFLHAEADMRSPIARVLGLFTGRPPRVVGVSEVLHDGDKLQLGDVAVEVYAVPGHTPGSAAYLVAGVLFLGDAASATTEGAIKSAPWVFSEDVDQAASSLRALARRLQPRAADVQHVAPAHTAPTTFAALAAF